MYCGDRPLVLWQQCYYNTAKIFSYDFQISKAPILATIQYDYWMKPD